MLHEQNEMVQKKRKRQVMQSEPVTVFQVHSLPFLNLY